MSIKEEKKRDVFEDLEIMYEDEDIIVMRAPDDDTLTKMVLKKITEAGRPLTWKELRTYFSGLAGEDRLRKILIKLIEEDKIIEMPDGTFGLPGMERGYIPKPDVKRVRPLVPRKFRERWGTSASKYRKLGIIQEIERREEEQ
ncbi:MAG: hypothetical protein LM586_01170 [Desulfurococcales archaeon]|jgi:hypothetical protein|nr:hypothetical protein [Desulfurococcales archaeon]MCI4456890.1 hypothetical protein [Desulfurococcaceae archaeon]